MRVLVANIPLPTNRFLVDLNEAISSIVDLQHSSDMFWQMDGDFDVVHLHFPEYLTYEVEQSYQRGLSGELIERVRERLEYWSLRSAIVVTRHVLLPHDAVKDPMWERMYETVYSYADGVVHFAEPSIREFEDRYRNTIFARGSRPEHTVIPHQNYASLPNVVTREEARTRLGIASAAKVMLVFGAIRNDAERQLVLDTFNGMRQKKKLLLVSRWRERLADVSWIRLKYWLRDLNRLYHRVNPQHHFGYGFIEEDDTQLYLNAADVLFIPRLQVLNSGNVTLGMTFGRVVVGPDSWDVGELLKISGNPVFDPEQPVTAVQAMEQGFALAAAGTIGENNRALALNNWKVEDCAMAYVAFFGTLLRQRESIR
jgi:hypothetical protein